MVRLEYFIVAQSASVDATTNRISLFNVLEDVRSAGPAIKLDEVAIVSTWEFEPNEIHTDFQLISRLHPPEGETHESRSNITPHSRRQRIIQRIVPLILDVAGDWRFEVIMNEISASHVVEVHIAPAAEEPPA